MRILILGFFAVMLLHGSLIGLTDDEAYYWVLAQKPSLGYAYHPPAVAWMIALSERLFGWVASRPFVLTVRMPAVLCATGVLALGLRWIKSAGVPREKLGVAGLTLISFAGVFALGWMMVPDLPLFLGWTMMFVAAWELCRQDKPRAMSLSLLLTGTALALISKYSAVLAVISAGLSLLIWAPPKTKRFGIAALVVGSVLGAAPALIWNSRHEWASLLWQIRDRHEGGSLSWFRYGRFWASQIALAGPFLVLFAARMGSRNDRALRYAGVWMLPAALVFFVQPLVSDFKPHWAFIAWWPAALGLAWASQVASASRSDRKLALWQRCYGIFLGLFILAACHFPFGGWFTNDPRMDVTNDLYGWDALPKWFKESGEKLPVVGSRYQTASQAAFALGASARVTMLPRDLKARDEWDDLNVSSGTGPDWPSLTAPVLYVADNRYSLPPQFPKADCTKLKRLEASRMGFSAKAIEVWKCVPAAARP